MKVNGEAIYGTEPIEPYGQWTRKAQEWMFTSKLENGKWVVYAILMGNYDLNDKVILDLSGLAKVVGERMDLTLPADVASKAVSGCRAQLLGYDMKMETVSVVGDQTLKLPKDLDWKIRKEETVGARGSKIIRPVSYRDMPPALVWRLDFE
jgi:hypothetical protein